MPDQPYGGINTESQTITEEVFLNAYFQSPKRVMQILQDLPGYMIHRDTEALRLSYSIFADSVSDLMDSIDHFRGEMEARDFLARPARQRFENCVLAVRRGVFSSSTSAMALVDHSRNLIKNLKDKHSLEVPEYQDRVNVEFTNNEEHKFIHSLRRCVCHVRMMDIDRETTYYPEVEVSRFLLKQEELLIWPDWNSMAKEFIRKHPNGIDIEQLFESYRRRVDAFHEWFVNKINHVCEPFLSQYLALTSVIDKFNVNSWWRILLKRVIDARIDPYERLNEYLTAEELAEVMSLPPHSYEQVDRIIDILDDHSACDKELRDLACTAFGVTDHTHQVGA